MTAGRRCALMARGLERCGEWAHGEAGAMKHLVVVVPGIGGSVLEDARGSDWGP